MDTLLEKNVVEVVKENKPITDECYNCGGTELVPLNDHKHNFADNEEIDNGILCSVCGCFHYLVGENITYEYIYKDILFGDENVEWKISDN